MEVRLQVLTHQNQRLAVQLEEKRKAFRTLENKVSNYESKEQAYEQTLLCVNRLWDQFLGSISHLCASLAGDADVKPPAPTDKAPAVKDPFLQRLVADWTTAQLKPVVDAQKRLDAELSEVEGALAERARGCKESLATVLDTIRSLHAKQVRRVQP